MFSTPTTPALHPLVRVMVDASMDAAAVVDRDVRVIYANSAYVRLTGMRQREFDRSAGPGMCHRHFDLESCDDGCLARRCMELGRSIRVDEVQARGRALRLHVVGTPLAGDDGVVWGALEQYRDVTAESTMQAEYRRMLAKERAERERLSRELAETTESSRAALEAERLQSRTDALTGVFNRRHLDACLADLLSRPGQPVAVLLLDLDHFKGINDRFGHAVGDATLREFAQVVRGSAREQDVVARFGGEEFAIVIPGGTIAIARAVADRLLERVRRGVQSGDLLTTASGGIGISPADGLTAEKLLRAADTALYQAKHAGRNRIFASMECAEASLIETPPVSPPALAEMR